MAEEKKEKKPVDRSDYFLAQPGDFVFHGKQDKKEEK